MAASIVTAGVLGFATGGIVRHLTDDHFNNASAACDTTSDNQAHYDAGFAAASAACDTTSDNQAHYDAGFAAASAACEEQVDDSNKCTFSLERNQPSSSTFSSTGVAWSNWSYDSPTIHTLKRDEINQSWLGASTTSNGNYAPSQFRIHVTPHDINNFKCCFQTTTSSDTSNPISWQTEEKCFNDSTTFTSSTDSSAVFISMYTKKI